MAPLRLAPLEVGASQVCRRQVGAAQVEPAQVDPLQAVNLAQLGPGQGGALQVGTRQHGAIQHGVNQLGTLQAGIDERGAAQIGAGEIGALQTVYLAQVGIAEVPADERRCTRRCVRIHIQRVDGGPTQDGATEIPGVGHAGARRQRIYHHIQVKADQHAATAGLIVRHEFQEVRMVVARRTVVLRVAPPDHDRVGREVGAAGEQHRRRSGGVDVHGAPR